MSEQQPVSMSPRPPETVLAAPDPEMTQALREALGGAADGRRDAVGAVVVRWPTALEAWAWLGRLSSSDADAYAAFRVGYHRGLDRLRQSGWRGSGHVRWSHPENRGFLRCLAGLQEVAHRIGEVDEDERCAAFLRQLDPEWPPNELWPDPS